MKITTEKTQDCQLSLTVEVDQAQVDQHLKSAARRLANKVRIPGFRKGKAPYEIVVRTLGKDALHEEALEVLGQEVYSEVLQEQDIKPYDQAQLQDVSFDPMVLKFLIPLQPEANLNKYRDIRVELEKVVTTDEDVEKALQHLREEKAEWNPVTRPLAEGDMGVVHLTATMDDDLVDDSDRSVIIRSGSTYPIPGFSEALLGMNAGETRSFDLAYPEEEGEPSESETDRTVHFEVTLKEVQEKTLPELDDNFAALIGDYESLDNMRARVRENLQAQAEHAAVHRYEDSVLDRFVEGAEIQFPPVMLEHQLDDLISERDRMIRQQEGVGLDDFLKMSGQTRDQFRSGMTEIAQSRLKRSLALSELAKQEKLTVEDEEIKTQEQAMLAGFGEKADELQSLLSTPQGQSLIRRDLLTRKAVERMAAIARGEAPALEPETIEGQPAAQTEGPVEPADAAS